MKLRAPAVPLINIDPYFSVWSGSNRLTDSETMHWTNEPNTISGTVSIDGVNYRFMGAAPAELPALRQASLDIDALSSKYTFRGDGVCLTAVFTSPLLPDDLDLLSRPVTYLSLSARSEDGKAHNVRARISVSEELCLNYAGQSPVSTEKLSFDGLLSMKMGNTAQNPLNCDGDDVRIDWGYIYLTSDNSAEAGTYSNESMTFIYVEKELSEPALFTFAYDDVRSIEYFGKPLTSWWNRNGMTISEAIVAAHRSYNDIMARCEAFSDKMFADATRAGGEKYAEMLQLAYRQAVSAHKTAADENGELLFISKECFSNGCAATVDVSYPSIPVFLLYNPELIRGMMRPIYKYAASAEWPFDFAPHDVGCYPKLNGQVYGNNKLEKQMPVEECGNMLIMEATSAVASGDIAFAASHMDILERWVVYLTENGADPENQLCTDDFAGHLAHNCNLSLKAIMGIESMSILCRMNGKVTDADKYDKIAREMAHGWMERAANGDGSYRLAFDRPDTFSMKYNIVWDKLFGTHIMPPEMFGTEVLSYRAKTQPFGLPLDNRQPYTKSDWLVWTATLAPDRETFEDMIKPMWDMYNYTESRVPMTDWYWTNTGLHKAYNCKQQSRNGDGTIVIKAKSFRNRTVVGGLFMKLLEYSGIMKL